MKKHLLNVMLFVVVIGIALAVRAKFERFTVPQNGMYPTLAAGSTHWVTKNRYESVSDFSVGEIVVFEGSHADKTYNFVWRVIAMPGDEVFIEFDEIQINGIPLGRELLRDDGDLEIFTETNGQRNYEVAYDTAAPDDHKIGCDLIVPDGHLFLLGDNRYNALDSRYQGPIPIEDVFGKLNP